jgi:Uroporphyrinogen-III decarboxylase
MTPRQRFLAACRGQVPDRIPFDLGGRVTNIAATLYNPYRQHFGLPPVERPQWPHDAHHSRLGVATLDEDFLEKLEVDTRWVSFVPPVGHDYRYAVQQNGDATYVDEWGCGLKRVESQPYFNYVDMPLAQVTNLDEVKNHPWPVMDGSRDEEWGRRVEECKSRGDYALCFVFKGVFEQTWPLRGLERTMMDMIKKPDLLEAIMDKVLESQISLYGRMADVIGRDLDLVLITDDYCGQQLPMFSRKNLDRFIVPRQREMFKTLKSKGVKVAALHSDGAVFDFIPAFIDMGAEVLNPVQFTAQGMEADRVKATYGSKIGLWGGLDTQHLLPNAGPEKVYEEVRKTVETLSRDGGYVFSSIHNVQGDTPFENLLAAVKAFQDVRDGR